MYDDIMGQAKQKNFNLIFFTFSEKFQTILFTTNDEVLEQISHFDISFQELLMEQMN